MLQRVQLLLDKETRTQLRMLAKAEDLSISAVVRDILKDGLKKKKLKKKDGGAAFLLKLAEGAVAGPGDSEYDKYAYDY